MNEADLRISSVDTFAPEFEARLSDLLLGAIQKKGAAKNILAKVRRGIVKNNKITYACYLNGALAGVLQGVAAGADRTAEIEQLYTHPDFQKKFKIGRSLVEKFAAAARRGGAAELSVISSNNAIYFYEKLNFKPKGTVPNFMERSL